jgi:flagellar motor switch protein FliG
MPKVEKGPKAAADIINSLNPDEQKRILSEIANSDPAMAKEIMHKLVNLDSLQFITAQMLSEFMKQLKPEILALALRTAEPNTIKHIVSLLPKAIAKDILQIVQGPPQAKAKVFEAVQQSLRVIREMTSKGLLVLRKDGDKYV